MREKIEEHIALQTAENLRAGLSAVEARRQAMLKFGGDQRRLSSRPRTLIYREFDAGCALRFSLVTQVYRLHHCGRRDASNGHRANAVVFGVLNALIPRPLNVPQAESLYELDRASDKLGIESYS